MRPRDNKMAFERVDTQSNAINPRLYTRRKYDSNPVVLRVAIPQSGRWRSSGCPTLPGVAKGWRPRRWRQECPLFASATTSAIFTMQMRNQSDAGPTHARRGSKKIGARSKMTWFPVDANDENRTILWMAVVLFVAYCIGAGLVRVVAFLRCSRPNAATRVTNDVDCDRQTACDVPARPPSPDSPPPYISIA